ncbi:MAG: shikimate kinase [Candidatus Vogelbacteria bacterium]|nr:shikimate kinase [Candidatus Vogelbacteria bacterium]
MNITLIGMAGAGKSTVGRALAEKLEYEFVDVDELLRNRFGKQLYLVIDEIGDDGFSAAESEAILSLVGLEDAVISPGGSVIYSEPAMNYLDKISKIVFLDVPFEIIEKRVDVSTRGLVGMGDKTLRELYNERRPQYLKHASVVVSVETREIRDLINNITTTLLL